MRKKIGLFAAGVLASVVAFGGALPAAAQDDTIDEQTREDVQGSGVCSSGWRYWPGAIEMDGFLPVGPLQANHNGTASPATVTFTSTQSATVTASADGSLSVDLSVKLATINAALGTTLTLSATAEIGNSIQITVPAGQYGYGEYGIWSNYITGEEQYWQGIGTVCNITERRTAGVLAPYRVGWNTWTA